MIVSLYWFILNKSSKKLSVQVWKMHSTHYGLLSECIVIAYLTYNTYLSDIWLKSTGIPAEKQAET